MSAAHRGKTPAPPRRPRRGAEFPLRAGRGSFRLLGVVLAALGCIAFVPAAAAAAADDPLAAEMRARVESAVASGGLNCRGEMICGLSLLPAFYARRDFAPAWSDAHGPRPAARALVAFLEAVGEDGLDPRAYRIGLLRELLRQAESGEPPPEAGFIADLDFLLTDAFLLLASHLRAGRVNPATLHSEWVVGFEHAADFLPALERAIATGEVAPGMADFRPPHPEYARLRAALARYRGFEREGPFPVLPDEARWQKGEGGETAALLRARLKREGDLPEGSGEAEEALEAALRRFQGRHGLEVDGRLGPRTLGALNLPLAARIRALELNLERWRWLPRDLGDPHIRVNIPGFDLAAMAGGDPALEMRVVAGRVVRRTPVFSSSLDRIVFNPDWNIPRRIAVEDILPKARRDPGYLRREKIRVFEHWGPDAAELDPAGIDWSSLSARDFRFRLMKDPGAHNDLGRVKFLFPNPFAVYLHDTPSRALFSRAQRGFSSGCIRIEKPLELAAWLLSGDPRGTPEGIEALLSSGRTHTVRLKTPVPLHLLYMTAAVDPDGTARFFEDLYGRDPVLDRALRETPPRLP